jgi:hypothetical protein
MQKLRKIIIRASLFLQTGIDALTAMPIEELLEILKEVTEIAEERKRIRTIHKNSR